MSRSAAFALILSASLAHAQTPVCRTSPAGTISVICASEAMVSESRGTLTPGSFSGLAACSSANEGTTAAVKDSTTNTWGATIAGGGSLHVLGYCDGTNWTVAAK